MKPTAGRNAQRARTVIFDFDGTLTRFDSSSHAVRQMILASPLRLLAALYALPMSLPFFLSRRTEALAGSLFVWIASARKSHDEWLGAMRRIASANLGAERINLLVVERLRQHLQQGDKVIIVTGSAATVARSICAALELDVPVIGSKLRPFLGGYISHIHCIGPRKVERLRQLHKLDRWDIVYSDSHRDIPLMQKAREVVLVNPGRRTLTRVRSALPVTTRLEVLRS